MSFFAQCRGVLFSDWQDDGAGKMRHSQHDSPLTPSPKEIFELVDARTAVFEKDKIVFMEAMKS